MFSEVRLKIQSCLVQTNAANDALPVAWEGVEFKRPASAPWLSLQIIWGGGGRFSSLGTPRMVRRTGIVQLNVNVPSDKGATVAERILEKIATACWRDSIVIDANSVIIFYPGDALSAGTKDSYYTVIYSVPFQVDMPEQSGQ